MGRRRVYTYRYTVTTRMTCIKMGSDESHFNISLIVRDKTTRPCPQTTTFEEKGEPKRYQTEVLRLPAYRLTARPNRLSFFFLFRLLLYVHRDHYWTFGDGSTGRPPQLSHRQPLSSEGLYTVDCINTRCMSLREIIKAPQAKTQRQ